MQNDSSILAINSLAMTCINRKETQAEMSSLKIGQPKSGLSACQFSPDLLPAQPSHSLTRLLAANLQFHLEEIGENLHNPWTYSNPTEIQSSPARILPDLRHHGGRNPVSRLQDLADLQVGDPVRGHSLHHRHQ